MICSRKRRSSILKSQRATRTPLSELEFNVATPTDTGKSRRVSFSRRTGVAEFITNEATTTWKNFYEEHNKSLESSGNDSQWSAPRQHIDHIGKCIIDQQFEEVEVVDLIENLNNPVGLNVNTSINFTQQLASLECTDSDRKVSAPLSNFELSTFTDQQSKVFGDELRIQSLCEMSGGINVNFSTVQTIEAKDDLDEMQRDLDRAQTNGDCHRPFMAHANMSDYIEIDLNTTRIRTEDVDMSVTDTVPSPKVEDVCKSYYMENKLNLSKDWMADKENIAIDPYVAPRESANFAINQESDKVLIFDGKKLTLQSEIDDIHNYRKNLLPHVLADQVPKRKTIVLNMNDDLPNFIDNLQVSIMEESKSQEQNKKSFHFDHDIGNMSTTHAVVSNLMIPGETDICNIEKTQFYGANTGNISITQGLPANIVCNEKSQKRRTILHEADTADISVTKAVSSNIILLDKDDLILEKSNKTALFETDYGDISMTQALPANIIVNKLLERTKTILYENDTGNISMTQALSGHIIQEVANGEITVDENVAPNTSIIKQSTMVVYESNSNDISFTQPISNQIQLELMPQHTRTTIFENNNGNNSVTQAISINRILSEQKVNGNSKCVDIATNYTTNPKNIYESEKTNIPLRIRTVAYEKDIEHTATLPQATSNAEVNESTNVKQTEKSKTIVYERDGADISITCSIPGNIVLSDNSELVSKKRQTILFDDNCDVSMTEALPYNLLLESAEINNKINTLEQPIHYNTSKTEPVETKQKSFLLDNIDIDIKELGHEKVVETNKRQAIDIQNDVDISITESNSQMTNRETATRNTSVFRKNSSVLSITKSYPPELLSLQIDHFNRELEKTLCEEKSIIHSKRDVLVYQAETTHSRSTSKLQAKKTDQGDLKSVKAINSDSNFKGQVTTYVSEHIDDDVNEIKSVNDNNNENKVITSNNEEIIEKESLDNSIACVIESGSDSNVNKDENIIEANKSLLEDLLDMSVTSMEDRVDDKNVMVKIQSKQLLEDNKEVLDEVKESTESMFYILKDSDEEAQTEKMELLSSEKEMDDIKAIEETPQLKDESPLQLEYVEENPEIVKSIQKKLGELKNILQYKKSPPKNRHYEKILSSDIDSEVTNREKSPKKSIDVSNVRKSIKNADDTNDLLQLLSDFTDNKVSDYIEEDEVNPEPVTVKGHTALAHKTYEPRRISFLPKRRSVISSEDLYISDFNDSENFDVAAIQSPDTLPLKKNVRISKQFVKALQFEDDTDSETSIQSDNSSPLKKTAFGETSYMKESKAKVIPSYLTDVPEEIKELMHDLVKPTADTIPFETSRLDKNLKDIPSTCSTQIQANLITSSQIDICTELYSNPASIYDIGKQTLADEVSELCSEVMSNEHKSPKKIVRMSASDKSLDTEIVRASHFKENVHQKSVNQEQTVPGRVLVFDHYNPLNNILLAPLDQCKAHKYNPIKSNETLCGSERSDSIQISVHEKGFEVERVSIHYNVENHVPQTCLVQPSGDACFEKNGDTQSVVSNLSKRVSKDQSIDAKMAEVKDMDVNTVIIMKGNKELLEASSSLTLVDDALTRSAFDVDIDSKDEIRRVNSPVKVIFQPEKHESVIPEKMDTDTSHDDEREQFRKRCKPKKRSYSPTKRDKQKQPISNLDITPKQMSKIQKLSNSPNIMETVVDMQRVSPEQPKFQKDKKSCIQEKDVIMEMKSKDERSPKKSKANKTGTTITVQQLMAECNIDENKLKEKIIEVLNEPKSITSTIEPKTEPQSDVDEVNSLDVISSCTSSKNLNEARENRTIVLDSQQTSGSSVRSRGCMSWHPELVNELSSRCLSPESESSANVVAKIDMLPFMGSRECEWETSIGDVWSFLLLHARVRLCVRLAHRHENAARTYVRADTPVEELSVEIARYDKKNPVASVCVGFGAEAMRYLCVREREREWGQQRGRVCVCERAGDVLALVRRCGAVARVALRWGRAMHDARLRLAYTLTDDGLLALKVANVPLRSVWEVTMRLELVVDDAREAPWPRASDVRVTTVLSDYPVSEEMVRRSIAHVPHDWGHVPRTIWRIFKYLKNRTQDDDALTM